MAISLSVVMRYQEDVASAAAGGAAALVSMWMIVQSQVFSLPVVHSVTFASALVIGVLGVAGLVGHELRTERVVHKLEVRNAHPEPADSRIAA